MRPFDKSVNESVNESVDESVDESVRWMSADVFENVWCRGEVTQGGAVSAVCRWNGFFNGRCYGADGLALAGLRDDGVGAVGAVAGEDIGTGVADGADFVVSDGFAATTAGKGACFR